jgi:disulfide bond formation protein DsbB
MRNPDSVFPAAMSPFAVAASNQLLLIAVAMFLIAAATILGALAFEHIGGYLPCALCLMQRWPYYIGVPLAGVAIAAVGLRAPRGLLILLFAAFAALMLYSAGLAAYHAGVEWKFWEGPAACAAGATVDSIEDMWGELDGTTHAPSCTDATWRMLGLSFAGWNVLVSLVLAALGAAGAAIGFRRTTM